MRNVFSRHGKKGSDVLSAGPEKFMDSKRDNRYVAMKYFLCANIAKKQYVNFATLFADFFLARIEWTPMKYVDLMNELNRVIRSFIEDCSSRPAGVAVPYKKVEPSP